MKIVILGLSITSSWGNGHATTYRGLVRELSRRGHEVTFLERDVPWYADNRDMPEPPYGRTALYSGLADLQARFEALVAGADLVMVGSYVPEGIAVGDWVLATARRVTAFYDIDTPVTLAAVESGKCEYLSAGQIALYRVYLSFTGGPTLRRIEGEWGSPCARAFYCSFDQTEYYPEDKACRWAMAYLGTHSEDRQPKLESLLCDVARTLPQELFAVAGPMYPPEIAWPANVQRIEHLAPTDHREFYNSQLLTLNITRRDMVQAGYSPSVRLFEAAACGTPIVSDEWQGIEEIFVPNREILIARTSEDVRRFLELPVGALRSVGAAARKKVLSRHTAAHRAIELESILGNLGSSNSHSYARAQR